MPPRRMLGESSAVSSQSILRDGLLAVPGNTTSTRRPLTAGSGVCSSQGPSSARSRRRKSGSDPSGNEGGCEDRGPNRHDQRPRGQTEVIGEEDSGPSARDPSETAEQRVGGETSADVLHRGGGHDDECPNEDRTDDLDSDRDDDGHQKEIDEVDEGHIDPRRPGELLGQDAQHDSPIHKPRDDDDWNRNPDREQRVYQSDRRDVAKERFQEVDLRGDQNPHGEGGHKQHPDNRFGEQPRRLLDVPREDRGGEQERERTEERIEVEQKSEGKAGQRDMGERVADEGHPLQDHEGSDVARGEPDEDPCDEAVCCWFGHRNSRAPKSCLCSARLAPPPKISFKRSGSENRLDAPKNRTVRLRAKTASEYCETMWISCVIRKTVMFVSFSRRLRLS